LLVNETRGLRSGLLGRLHSLWKSGVFAKTVLLSSWDDDYDESVKEREDKSWKTTFMGVAIMVPLLLAAPVQCPAYQDPRREPVEQPAEAVYRSALRLRELGYRQAEEATLRHLISRYPQSRWAERARIDLSSRQQDE